MNLYLRLLLALLRTWRSSPIVAGETVRRSFRVLPNDLDINAHMNNGRYLTMIDLMIVEYFVRCGFAKILLRNRWRPVVGGSIITYRRGLAPFATYELALTAEGRDQFWNYLRFEFRQGERVCAVGYIKGATIARGKLIDTATSFAGMEDRRKPELSPAVRAWKDAETLLAAS